MEGKIREERVGREKSKLKLKAASVADTIVLIPFSN